MKRLQTQYNSSLLMITHNLGIVSELCQQVAVIYAGRVIEYGPVREVFRHPAHPYTAGLLNAIPRLTGERERLHAIPGRVADAQERPQGCAFSPRCRHCGSRCAGERPEMRQIAGGHYAACFHREGGEA